MKILDAGWRTHRVLAVMFLFALRVAPAAAAAVPESTYSALHWRLLGPFRGGWATCAAGVPGDPATFYFGGADGGVWKTSDAGVTWTPLFNDQGSASIGALALAPSDPRVLWVGTGQVHQRWDIVSGDGVYRSRDGGATWEHVGLADTRHIGAIWVDPRSAGTALVAALGHVFGPNEERGVFRTEDGGKSWQKVLYRDADTGAVDLAADPAVPDTIYAALWQVRRYPWLDYFQPPVGAGSGIWRSEDGGRTWAAVGGRGLPPAPFGRVGLAVARGTSGRRVYAAIHAPQGGGLYRSDDGGATWTQANADSSLASAYMNRLTPDPRDPDVVWAMGRSLRRSTDGGHTFTIVKGAPGGDDYHFLWIDPGEPRRMITGADQGAVVTLNGGASWSSWYNQPTGQFYRLAADSRFPYWIYSGQQDSGTAGLASRSDYGQLTFRDWHPVGGDERDGDIPDPADPDVVYGAGLGGRLSRWDAKTGQVQNVSPWPVVTYGQRLTGVRFRYTWITPIAISPRPPHAIYQGAQVLFRSRDGGRTWQIVSPDLSGAAPARATAHTRPAGAAAPPLPPQCQGDVRVEDATACGYGVIFAIAASPAADGLVWVGTDNGRVQLTRDDGGSWNDVTPPDMEDWTKVNTIDASPSDPGTAYVAADRHRRDDLRPLAWRTHDFGATWTEIGHGLPAGAWLGALRQDPERLGLLYAGTSRGVHVSFDDGEHWQSLQVGLPTTGINDLLVHGDDLIAATQGRAIWALDDLQPLRHAADAAAAGGAYLVPPATAYRLAPNRNKDTPLPPEEPRGANPPVGAVIDYVLPAAPAGPVTLEIVAPDGLLVRRFKSDETPPARPAGVYFADLWRPPAPPLPARAGHNRFVWDVRWPQPHAAEYEHSIAALPGQPTPTQPQGPFALPGDYEVRLTVDGRTLTQPLTVAADPRAAATPEDLRALLDFQREVIAALERAAVLAEAREAAEKRLGELTASPPPSRSARQAAERAKRELDALAAAGADEDPGALGGVLASIETDLESADAAPTDPQRQLLAETRDLLTRAEERWQAFAGGALAVVERAVH